MGLLHELADGRAEVALSEKKLAAVEKIESPIPNDIQTEVYSKLNRV